MRLWTLHPRYLDVKGLLAAWREGLLAQKVLQDQTVGYRHHPQLKRFRSSPDPLGAIGKFLLVLQEEASRRGYRFQRDKIVQASFEGQILCTRGQLLYEWKHLREKLRHRDSSRYSATESIEEPEPHPLFRIVDGEIEDWEIIVETKQAQRHRALVLCGDLWHPARIPQKGMQALRGTGFTFDWMEDAREWSADLLRDYPLVILTKSNNMSSTDPTGWMTDEAQAAFAAHVRRGNGLLAIHSGTAEYEHKPVLRRLLGGVFTHHPEQCPVTVSPRPGHPLSEGVTPFTVRDEHYFMALDDPQADVFVTTTSEHGEQPAAWTRLEGNGRVAVLTPGHNMEVWLHPSFQALLRNCLRWCGKLI